MTEKSTVFIDERNMNSRELSSEDGRSARPGSSSRREFLGRTIRGGALLAATTVLGNELRTPENQAESQTNHSVANPPSDSGKTTADLLVEKLVDWGVSVVFGLPGDKNAWILDALHRNQDKIRFVLVRHEEGAAFMASGYAKFTGKLGVCVSTAGPGAVHLLNGLYDAKFDGVPVLAVTGSPPRALLGTRFTQGVDTISLYKDVTDGVYNELIIGPYHFLSVADTARRAALFFRVEGLHISVFLSMCNQNDSSMTTNLLVPMSSTAWRQVGCRKSKCRRRTRSALLLIC